MEILGVDSVKYMGNWEERKAEKPDASRSKEIAKPVFPLYTYICLYNPHSAPQSSLMKFELIPVLSIMEELYKQPISAERFQAYLSLLQGGTKGDLILPIGGFNPMAKDHVLTKLYELKALQAEELIQEVAAELNATLDSEVAPTIQIGLNLADDLKGGWTNRHATDFDSKFKINALVERNFCTPFVWSSEAYTADLIRSRTFEYAYRTLYWKHHSRLVSLEDHVNQEVYVCRQVGATSDLQADANLETIQAFYADNKEEEEYSVLFNFFYGDAVSSSLNYPAYGITEINGFEFAELLAQEGSEAE